MTYKNNRLKNGEIRPNFSNVCTYTESQETLLLYKKETKKSSGFMKAVPTYGVVVGFHLPADGEIFEKAIDPTLKELQKITNKIIDFMPNKFISVI